MLISTVLRNRYKVLRKLGSGGFGDTFLSVDMDLPGNPKCVVKHLQTKNTNQTVLKVAKRLFEQEADVLYRLGKGHSRIPELFAHFEEEDEFYLVQEYVDGEDLTTEIRPRQPLNEFEVTKLLQEILEVLAFVHKNNVIHRDIKLRNIMRRRDGKIVLIDFGAVKEINGLASSFDGDVNSTMVIGTPGYMPSEQANGKPRLCSDVYAVGMIGVQALTGISPRDLPLDPNTGEVMWQDKANVSEKLGEVLTNMVRCNFSQRYQTAGEALQAVKSPVTILPKSYQSYNKGSSKTPADARFLNQLIKTLALLGIMGAGFSVAMFKGRLFPSTSSQTKPLENKKLIESKEGSKPSLLPVPSTLPNIKSPQNRVLPTLSLPSGGKTKDTNIKSEVEPKSDSEKSKSIKRSNPQRDSVVDKSSESQPNNFVFPSLPKIDIFPRGIPKPKPSVTVPSIKHGTGNNPSKIPVNSPGNPSKTNTPTPNPIFEPTKDSTSSPSKIKPETTPKPTTPSLPQPPQETTKDDNTSVPSSEGDAQKKENPPSPDAPAIDSNQKLRKFPVTPAIENEVLKDTSPASKAEGENSTDSEKDAENESPFLPTKNSTDSSSDTSEVSEENSDKSPDKSSSSEQDDTSNNAVIVPVIVEEDSGNDSRDNGTEEPDSVSSPDTDGDDSPKEVASPDTSGGKSKDPKSEPSGLPLEEDAKLPNTEELPIPSANNYKNKPTPFPTTYPSESVENITS